MNKRQIPWRAPLCGGPTISGSNLCRPNPQDNDLWVCSCRIKPANFNFFLHYHFLLAVQNYQAHLSRGIAVWERMGYSLFSNYPFNKYQIIDAKSLCNKWVSLRKDTIAIRSRSEGFETHPDSSPYEILLSSLVDEYLAEEDKKKSSQNHKKDVDDRTTLVRNTLIPTFKERKLNLESTLQDMKSNSIHDSGPELEGLSTPQKVNKKRNHDEINLQLGIFPPSPSSSTTTLSSSSTTTVSPNRPTISYIDIDLDSDFSNSGSGIVIQKKEKKKLKKEKNVDSFLESFPNLMMEAIKTSKQQQEMMMMMMMRLTGDNNNHEKGSQN